MPHQTLFLSGCRTKPCPYPAGLELFDGKQLLLVMLGSGQVHHTVGALSYLPEQVIVLLQAPTAALATCGRRCCCRRVVVLGLLLLLLALLLLCLVLAAGAASGRCC